MLQTGAVDVSRLISHRLPLDGFAHGVELIERGQENVLKVQIIPAGH
jgi:threonine dehydrogenase-like Zn-dependent dehydrogenase